MKFDGSPFSHPLHTASVDDSKPSEDQLDGGFPIEGDCGAIDSSGQAHVPPPPPDSGTRGYAVEIFGDESGGQTPKLPRQKGRQDE